jgi:hypothetical protein
MLTFKSAKNGTMSDILKSVIESEIQREYAPDETEALVRKFHSMYFGSTEYLIRDEDGICTGEYGMYSGDVAAIFDQLKVPVKFIDVNGKVLAVDGSGSGILKSIPANK